MSRFGAVSSGMALISAAAVISCSQPANPFAFGDAHLRVTTDMISYEATPTDTDPSIRDYQFTIDVRIENLGTGTARLDRCLADDEAPMYVVTLPGDRPGETSAYRPIWGCTDTYRPILLAPGEVRNFRYQLLGPNLRHGGSRDPIGVFTGPMAIMFLASDCQVRNVCATIPATSNTFEVAVVE